MNIFRTHLGIGLQWWPWRYEQLKWDYNSYKRLINDVKATFPTERSQSKKLRIAVLGPRGHGKSALINSFASVSAEKRTGVCHAAESGKNVSTVFRYYDFPGLFEHVSVGDTYGLMKEASAKDMKPLLNTLKKLINGHIEEGYEFKKYEGISEKDDFYIENPTPEDKIQCVIIVYDCQHISPMHENHVDSLGTIIEHLYQWNVPVVVVLTKADKKSIHVEHDIERIFRCDEIEKAVDDARKYLHVPVANVHPVVNFEEQCEYNWKNSIPLLLALRSCMNLAQAYLHNASKPKKEKKTI